MSFLDNLSNDDDKKDFDVFISYGGKNLDTAKEICEHLEEHGLKCWIAPRNITPGRQYPEDIMLGIIASKIVVLIFSEYSHQSKYVRSELENAFKYNKPILTYNIDGSLPEGKMKHLIESRQWIMAEEPKKKDYDKILENAKRLCKKSVKNMVFPWSIRGNVKKTREKDIISLILLLIPFTYSFAYFYMGIIERMKEWIAIGIIYLIPLLFWIYGLGGNVYNAAKVSMFIQLFIAFYILSLIFGLLIIRKEFLARKTVKKMVDEDDKLFDVYVDYFSRL